MLADISKDPCYVLIDDNRTDDTINDMFLIENIEKGNKEMKLKCLRNLVLSITNGVTISGSVLMAVIRFLLPSSDHDVKRLLLLFWELLPKSQPNGQLINEMILVVDAYRKDLEHPNEYIRAFTLRFLCKIRNAEILESLMPSIKKCLDDNNSFVRRNAVMAIFTIHKFFEKLITNAPQLILKYLQNEKDNSCLRNAFIMMIHVDKKELAFDFLKERVNRIINFDSSLQLVIVELISKIYNLNNMNEKNIFIPVLKDLMTSQSTSNAVKYEAANAILELSPTNANMKAIVHCFVELLYKESDSNVRFVVLNKLLTLIKNHSTKQFKASLSNLAVDILSLLSKTEDQDSSTLDINVARIIITIVKELSQDVKSCKSSVDIIGKEIVKLQEKVPAKYRGKSMKKLPHNVLQLLIETLESLFKNFPENGADILPILIENIPTCHSTNSVSLINMLILISKTNPEFNSTLLTGVMGILTEIKELRTLQETIWLFVEFSNNPKPILLQLLVKISQIFFPDCEFVFNITGEHNSVGILNHSNSKKTPKILPDGSYASQTPKISKLDEELQNESNEDSSIWRSSFKGCAFIIFLSNALLNLMLRVLKDTENFNHKEFNRTLAYLIYTLAQVNHCAEKHGCKLADYWSDVFQSHMNVLIHINDIFKYEHLSFEEKVVETERIVESLVFKNDDHISYTPNILKSNVSNDYSDVFSGPDVPLSFGGIFKCEGNLDDFNSNDNIASGKISRKNIQNVLSKVVQLSGLSDPIYIETLLTLNSFDVHLDTLIVNRTLDSMNHVSIEIATQGKTDSIIRSKEFILPPHGFKTIKQTVKVSSIENGVLFGNIVYNITGSQADSSFVVLNPIVIDIAEYSEPYEGNIKDFLGNWNDFEWENKININTNFTNMKQFLRHIIDVTKMVLVGDKIEDLFDDSKFLSCNVAIKSVFGEEALANICMEQIDVNHPGHISGYIRLRAASQGLAMNIGDKFRQCMFAENS